MTTAQVGAVLGRSHRTISRLANLGELPAQKHGHTPMAPWIILSDKLRAWCHLNGYFVWNKDGTRRFRRFHKKRRRGSDNRSR